MLGVFSDNYPGSLTIIENVLNAGESMKGEEGAGQLHPHPRDLQEGVGGGSEKSHSSGLHQDSLEVV